MRERVTLPETDDGRLIMNGVLTEISSQRAVGDVESVSFNATLAELSRMRRELDDLVGGIHRHLDHLRTLGKGPAPHGPGALSGATEDLERAVGLRRNAS